MFAAFRRCKYIPGDIYDWLAGESLPKEDAMDQLPAQLLPVVRHINFLIFNISVPNLIIGVVLTIVFFLGAWARLPHFIEHGKEKGDSR
jgi:hypothetical protein